MRLVEIVAQLRAPDGCPWDRKQTIGSLSHYVLEEAYEVVDAIERADVDMLREEIGDHIFEAVFLAQIAAENGWFRVDDSLEAVTAKLIRRHPHVFQPNGQVHDSESKERAPSAEAALARWNALKEQERTEGGRTHATLGGIPVALPALLRAFKIGKRTAEVGFDWVRAQDVLAKIEEEVAELRETFETDAADTDRAEEEMGDLLFAIANLSRKLDIEPEAALRKANDKFTARFATMERAIVDSGRSLRDMSLDELENEWAKAKMGKPFGTS
ncbi:MAG: nucleoside triphosphate pyrophosphohydrolase [Blastocatellia bacterium]|nr:MAG: nucleoside triphosphate pyrophosphohydrolase [Blastocatellia bacterium]